MEFLKHFGEVKSAKIHLLNDDNIKTVINSSSSSIFEKNVLKPEHKIRVKD